MRRLACALLLAALLAACGGGGSDDGAGDTAGGDAADQPTTPATAANYVEAITTASKDNGLGNSDEMNRCFAESYVETVGVDALAAKVSVDEIEAQTGFTPDALGIRLTPAQRDAFYQALKTCSDPRAYFVDIFSSGNHLTAADRRCLDGVVDDKILETMLVAAFDGDTSPVEQTQDMGEAFQRIGTACPHIAEAGGL
jgi:hypothetical protein